MQNSGGYRAQMQPQMQHHQSTGNAAQTGGGQPQQQLHYQNQQAMRNPRPAAMNTSRYPTQNVFVNPQPYLQSVAGYSYNQVPTPQVHPQPVASHLYFQQYPPHQQFVVNRPIYYQQQQQTSGIAGVPHHFTSRLSHNTIPVQNTITVYPGQAMHPGSHGPGVTSGSHPGPGQQQQAQISQSTGQNQQSQPQLQTQQQAPQVPVVPSSNAPQTSVASHGIPPSHPTPYGRLNDGNQNVGGGNNRLMEQNPGQVPVHVHHVPAMGPKESQTGTATRKRRVLNIIDPTSGKSVINPNEESSASTEPAKSEEGKTTPAVPASDIPEVSASGATTPTSTAAAVVQQPAVTSAEAPATATAVAKESTPDDSTTRKKAEFFNKISKANDTKKSKSEDSSTVQRSGDEDTTSEIATPVDDSVDESSKEPVVTPGSIPSEEHISVEEALAEAAKEDAPEPTVLVAEKGTSDVSGKEQETEVKTVKADSPKEAVIEDVPSMVQLTESVEVADIKPADAHVLDQNEDDSDVNHEVAAINENPEPSTEATAVASTPILTNGVIEKFDEDDKENVPLSDSHDMSTVSISPVPLDDYIDNGGDESNISEFVDDGSGAVVRNARADHVNEDDDQNIEDGEITADEKDLDGEDRIEGNGEAEIAKPTVRRYRRDELLAISHSPAAKKKVDIPISDVIKDAKSNNNDKMNNYNMNMRQQPSRGMGGPGRGGRLTPISPMQMNMHHAIRWPMGQALVVPPPAPGQHQHRPPRELILVKEKVELNKAENAWKPSHAQGRRGGGGGGGGAKDVTKSPEEMKTDEIVKQTRGILNKLTPENFDKLVEKFLKLELNDQDDRIKAVIRVVFEKAIDEPTFATSYARMVNYVCRNSQETARRFRKEILDTCQTEFSKNTREEEDIKTIEEELANAPDDKKDALKADLEEKRFQLRRRSLGNVRFIGELYKLSMLTPKIMVECVNMLLGSNDEENIECLCKLLTTVGQILETQLRELKQRADQAKSSGSPLPRFIPENKWMDNRFAKLKSLSTDNKLSSRIRFALLDVIELRENDWKPRRDSNAPKTIDEVRRDAARQEQEEKQRIHALPEATGGHQRRSSPGLGMNQPMSTQGKKGDNWNTVASNKSSRFTQSLQKKQESAGSPVLAPPSGGWGGPPAGFGRPGGSSFSTKPNLPPRLIKEQQSQMSRHGNSDASSNRFAQLGSHHSQPSSNTYSGPSNSPSLGPSHGPGLNALPLFRPTPPSSLPTPAPTPPPPARPAQPAELEKPKDDNETVKNILGEYLTIQNYEDTEHWILDRFPGDKVLSFADLLARQVGEISKDQEQRGAAKLINKLIKSDRVSLTRDKALEEISQGIVKDIPDIRCDCPKVASYIATFCVEIFGEEPNLNWLVTLSDPLNEEDFKEDYDELIANVLNLLKFRTNESNVKSLWEATEGKEKILIDNEDIQWLNESRLSLVEKMIPVLENFDGEKSISAFKEQWDLRLPEISAAVVLAICQVSFKNPGWDLAKLECWLQLLNKSATPDIWKAAKEFIESKRVSKGDEDLLWDRFMNLKLVNDKDR